MPARAFAAGFVSLLLVPTSALAWGRTGHAVVADIARGYLTPKAAAVDAILASDADPLTTQDLAARASWADAWRAQRKDTASWHFVNNPI
ncbi:S1/P1 nuclease [Caulobacter hibisci]|uniref:S1/P1 nuclease n=1 Tax=Caulobacter hibisci TaxID=2035993 RepID=UPI0018E2A7A4|nr:S1/P1 nuclease [Caulobacter hibisci]